MPGLELPFIDLSDYVKSQSAEASAAIIKQVSDASERFGFFQVKGHGVPLNLQRRFLASLDRFFKLPTEDKLKLSYLNNPSRRGYEASGMSMRDGDPMPDSKEAFYLGREDPQTELSGFYGPNVWPDLPTEEFRDPVWEYYNQTSALGKTIWEILLQGLGHSPDKLAAFAKRPLVQMKMIRYPSPPDTLPGQFGVGAHNDFGGVTVLLQQPGRHGLEVWLEEKQEWIQVPALEDVFVINCGDMVMRWSSGKFKSVRHRVLNKAAGERLSCATFFHGDVFATNPLNPGDPDKETVGQLLVKRFRNQMHLTKETIAEVEATY